MMVARQTLKGYPNTHVSLKPRPHARKYDLPATELTACTFSPFVVSAYYRHHISGGKVLCSILLH